MVKATPTRTLNPLPFQDLEPHRFEDLIRQLAYDMRRWKSLEATGRSGSDDGLDIRAIEVVSLDERSPEEVLAAEERIPLFGERLWIFQCKREKSLSPKRLGEVVAESLVSLPSPPHGFILTVACDVSKKARDVFREEMVKRGIEEFAIWARSELEDMLFQAKNDRLLFAYFGLSLQPRRRSLFATQRSQIAVKKQLSTILRDGSSVGTLVLLRDPTDERYPENCSDGERPARWVPCMALHTKEPGCLTVLHYEHLAWVKADGSGWDALSDDDLLRDRILAELRSKDAWLPPQEPKQYEPDVNEQFWHEYVPATERAHLKILRFLPLERILAIDTDGDGYYPIPHLLIESDPGDGQWMGELGSYFEPMGDSAIVFRPEADKRISLFPDPLPKTLYPPPPGFDQTSSEAAVLSDAVAARMAQIFSPMERRLQPDVPIPDTLKEKEPSKETLQSFREWRASVALPVFSAFVHRLRDAGHDARVVVRSNEPRDGGTQASEHIVLRVHFLGGAMSPSGYIKDGHISVSAFPSSLDGRIEARLGPESSSSPLRGATKEQLTATSMTAEDLAQFIVSFLERFRRKF